ncbi:MAG: PBSX family phage terminase large subunit, partial [Acutalibacteraceae bacterium]|nr:PBSX family phage terminase large subunit [Acutalibacteraceae bacterium]
MSEIKLSEIIGGGYDDFWSCEKRYRVLKGGKGSKKSATTALNFIYRLMKYEGSNLLVVRQVMNTHRDSTFAQLKWAQERLNVSHLWKNTVSPMEMVYTPTGQRIIFRGFDDVLKLASTTVPTGYLNFVWIEEAFEISLESDFDKLDLSVPRGNVEPPLYKQTTLTFNPWSGTHWLKKRFFDTESEDIATFSTNYLINEFLDDTDRAVFERMKKTNRRKYE